MLERLRGSDISLKDELLCLLFYFYLSNISFLNAANYLSLLNFLIEVLWLSCLGFYSLIICNELFLLCVFLLRLVL